MENNNFKKSMTLEERVALIKESLDKMSQEEFEQMLYRNGYHQVKEENNNTSCKAMCFLRLNLIN